ncbi:MAG: type II 3-dehydroquinate dehydratase [Candidatus Rifleibacteriota bacterium]
MIYVVNGPNLNLLGRRQTEIYGNQTLQKINEGLKQTAEAEGFEISFFQSNHEGELIDFLQKMTADDKTILNPGGLGHTSVSLRDCIAAIDAVIVEVHISNIYSREEFRRHSLISPVCRGVIAGFGPDVYRLALNWLMGK